MANNNMIYRVIDKTEYFNLSTEKVELSEKGNATTICITTNMKWNIKQ